MFWVLVVLRRQHLHLRMEGTFAMIEMKIDVCFLKLS